MNGKTNYNNRVSRRTAILAFSLFLSLTWSLPNGFGQHTDPDVIYQISTLAALSQGDYDGKASYASLERRGDFGLGTFEAVDGEMIALDGEFYRVRTDGIAYPVRGGDKTPFANVTFFEADLSALQSTSMDYQQLLDYLDTQIPDPNGFYAIKVEGIFQYVQTRSVPKQDKPYPPLSEVTANQVTFEFQHIEGTMVGFRFPASVHATNVNGYHFHFLTKDRKAGGHLLDCATENVEIGIDESSMIIIQPEGGAERGDAGKR